MTDTHDSRPLLDAMDCIEESKKQLFTCMRRLASCHAYAEIGQIQEAMNRLDVAAQLIAERGTREAKKLESGVI